MRLRSLRRRVAHRGPGVVRESLTIRVVSVSTRAATGVYEDRTGPPTVATLRSMGHDVADPVVVADGEPLAEALQSLLAESPDVIITSGGTGLTPKDLTPEVTRRFLDREIPGVVEALRLDGRSRGVDTAALSRGVCGVAGSTFIVNLPGSIGGARDGVAVLAPLLTHAVDQIAGGDH